MDWKSILSSILLMAGTWIETQGWMSQAEWAQVVGAIVIIAAAIWKWWNNRQKAVEVKALKLKVAALENK